MKKFLRLQLSLLLRLLVLLICNNHSNLLPYTLHLLPNEYAILDRRLDFVLRISCAWFTLSFTFSLISVLIRRGAAPGGGGEGGGD